MSTSGRTQIVGGVRRQWIRIVGCGLWATAAAIGCTGGHASGAGELAGGPPQDDPPPLGNSAPTTTPTTIATAIAAGAAHTCARMSDGSVMCWGDNDSGQLGDSNVTSSKSSVPANVKTLDGDNLTGVVAIAAGSYHTCALKAKAVMCWGDNGSFRLGNSTVTASKSNVPVKVKVKAQDGLADLTGVAAISAGHYHTCVLMADSSVMCWGDNGSGQLGDGTKTSSSVPVNVLSTKAGDSALTGVAAISAGDSHTCALMTDKTVKCWGDNGSFRLGNSDVTSSNSKVPVNVKAPDGVADLTGVIAISAGTAHTCASRNKSVVCWGDNGSFRLGNSELTASKSKVPVKVKALDGADIPGVAAISAGHYHTCALTGDSVICWGDNDSGQLGDGTTASKSSVPVNVIATKSGGSALTGVAAISAGDSHACALMTDGSVKCWGDNGSFRLGNSEVTASSKSNVPVNVKMPNDTADLAGGADNSASDGNDADNINKSAWVYYQDNKLTYKTYGSGDKIMDFSHAGYMGGGVQLPSDRALQTISISPSGGDDSSAIQAAIDTIATYPQIDAFRGRVALGEGVFKISKTLRVTTSGIIISGQGADKSILKYSSESPSALFKIGTGSEVEYKNASKSIITDDYVAVGSTTFSIENSTGYTKGMSVSIARTISNAWIESLNMDDLVDNGARETWLEPTTKFYFERKIVSVNGNEITVDIPLSDGIDKKFSPSSYVVPHKADTRISQIGLENFGTKVPVLNGPIGPSNYAGVSFDGVYDSWMKNIYMTDNMSGVSLSMSSKQITLENVTVDSKREAFDNSKGYPADFRIEGQQILLYKCNSYGDNADAAVTLQKTTGPNVILDIKVLGQKKSIEPHERWATGLLVDNASGPTVSFGDRGTYGSGHGWSVGNGVVWNSQFESYKIDNPPGYKNFGIGISGADDGSTGEIDSANKPVTEIPSLYLAQLSGRLNKVMTAPY